MKAPRDRLDSWKSIADYLGRDERTVRRWEKALGLPVRRLPGGRGHSVFAYVDDVEKWLRNVPPSGDGIANGAAPPTIVRQRPWGLISAVFIALVIAGALWGTRGGAELPLAVRVTDAAVIAVDASGAERWRYPFPAGERVLFTHPTSTPTHSLADGGVVVAIMMRERLADGVALGGQLLALSPSGRLQRVLVLDDQVSFSGVGFGAPWDIIDFRATVRDGEEVIALAAHHDQWWPGLVTVLDAGWRRRGTFVNPGWVESVDWLADGRLLAAGFSNAWDGGMVVVLDADAIDGQAPEAGGSAFRCDGCGDAHPVRYIVFPRSELNRVTAAGFNRAVVRLTADSVRVSTSEASPGGQEVVSALYEFSPTLELRRAGYDDRYWDLHRALEAQGVLKHSRPQCPERYGPVSIQVWEPDQGWHEVPAAVIPAT